MNHSKGNFSRSERFEKGQIWLFCYFLPIYSKVVWYIFFISCIQLLGDDIDQLSRDGLNWIIQKVIFKVGKVRFSPFSHNYWYYSIVTKCCPNLLHHVASLLWNQSCPKIWKVWNHSNDFQVTLTSWRIFDFMMNFLAPPAERQRSFCNADSSVVRRPSSSVVCRRRRRPSSTFQLKAWFLKNCLITFFLFWYVASLGMQLP